MIGNQPAGRKCSRSGYSIVPASGEQAWRVTKDRYVTRDGVNGARVNDVVGPLRSPFDPDGRCRFDTLGRTVYFGEGKKVALAECLQAFRQDVMSMMNDAAAIGVDVETYRKRLVEEAHARGNPGPGEIPVEWQMNYSLYRVDFPNQGWWVCIEEADTLNSLSTALRGAVGQITRGDVYGEDRGLTTRTAQEIRESVLEDGTSPLGIVYQSKTGYGRCWAWWNRRADGHPPSGSDPVRSGSENVNVPELQELIQDWDLKLT